MMKKLLLVIILLSSCMMEEAITVDQDLPDHFLKGEYLMEDGSTYIAFSDWDVRQVDGALVGNFYLGVYAKGWREFGTPSNIRCSGTYEYWEVNGARQIRLTPKGGAATVYDIKISDHVYLYCGGDCVVVWDWVKVNNYVHLLEIEIEVI